MIYKILSVVFALLLCSIPVFAAEQSEELVYLCEQHNCLAPTGTPDAVCANCYFYGSEGYGYSAEDEIYTMPEVYTRDTPFNVPYLTRFRAYQNVLSPDGNYVQVYGERDYVHSRELVEFESRGEYYDITDAGWVSCAIGVIYEETPGYKQFWGFSYSPVRESYICTFPYGVTNPRIVLGDTTFDGISFYDLSTSSVTVNAIVRATSAADSTAFVPFSQSGLFRTNYGVYSSGQKYIFTDSGNQYPMYSFLATERYADPVSKAIPSQSNGYQNLWVSYDLALDIPYGYTWQSADSSVQPSPFNSEKITGTIGSYFSSPSAPNMITTWTLPLLYDEPVIQLEYKRLLVVDGHFDVANGEYPAKFPGGGVIPGITYPSGDGSWEDKQFEQGVNPELSDTASSVTDGIDSMLDFEAGIYEDLNRYKSEIDFGNYSIPDTLAASFGWLSNKFMGFFDSVPDLRPIILFPAYLAIVVAIVHGLENAGARSSAAIIRQSNYETRSEERSTSARRFWRLMFKRSGKGG